jgi:predicted ATPase
MLTAVRLKDFKNHIDTEIRLGRLTCLVGPNGCGKTSVLEAVQFACTTLAKGAAACFSLPSAHEDLIRRGEKGFSVSLKVTGAEVASDLMTMQIVLSDGPPFSWDRWNAPQSRGAALADNDDEHSKFDVSASWELSWDSEAAIQQLQEGGTTDLEKRITISGETRALIHSGWDVPKEVHWRFRRAPTTAFSMTPEIRRLRCASYSPDEIPALGSDGEALASVIAYLITAEPERFAELMKRIRDVLPFVERLRVRPAKVQLTEPTTVTVNRKEIPYWENREVIGHELLFDLKGAAGIPARAVSEGTLLVTALLTATVWNQGADILLIDDLEKGLHPKAQRELLQALKALIDADPQLQIVFSSHSPYVVDELEADQVWILVPDDRRGVVARQLSDHPRAEDALKVLTTGEFLSAEGEDWVRDAPPPGASG